MTKRTKIVLVAVLSVLVCAIAAVAVWLIMIPRLDLKVYNNHNYIPLPEGYILSYSKDKPIGRIQHATVYTIKDDPDVCFLIPVSFYTTYNLWVREDIHLPTLGDGEIEFIDVIFSKDNIIRDQHEPSESIRLNSANNEKLIKAYNERMVITEDFLGDQVFQEFRLRIGFKNPKGLTCIMSLYKTNDGYGLLLEDGKTLVSVTGLEMSDGCQGDG